MPQQQPSRQGRATKLAAFDMDGTLLAGRLVFALSEKFGLDGKVRQIQQQGAGTAAAGKEGGGMAGHEQTRAIAALFAGLTRKDLESAIESIPLARNCERAISALREKNYRTGIISDSYTIAAGYVAGKLGMDFAAANELEIDSGGKITGRVKMPLGWERIGCFCKISVCKRYHLEEFARQFGVRIEDTIAVGDTKSDVCMVRRAGVGIAFMPKDPAIVEAASSVVGSGDLLEVLGFAP